jgi:predicted DsbA family dithiol-disulfide isomerase
MPFDLHPEYPPEGVYRSELEKRYGAGFTDHVRAFIENEGMEYGPPDKSPRSVASLQVSELARDRDRFEELHERMFRAYWAEGRDIGDREVLVSVGIDARLEPAEINHVLDNDIYLDRIQSSTRTAHDAGVSGVPAWVIDHRYLIPGAQPHEVFERVLERLGYSPIG